MSTNSAIEWTDTTWNPVTGCSKVSAGCTNCYAEKLSHRFGWTKQPWNAAFAGENVQLHPDRLNIPLTWRKPRKVFVNSMSDLFHEEVPDEFLDQVFTVMAQAKQHVFQVLTKRPERMLRYMQSCERGADAVGGAFPWPNVWLGVSVENQQAADERIPLLLQTPATVRFLSCEPLLGTVSLDRWLGLEEGHEWAECLCEEIDSSDRPCITCSCRKELGRRSGLHWVIVGGESGPGARPMHPDWARSLRDQSVAGGVPFFFKQHGEYTNPGTSDVPLSECRYKSDYQFDDGTWVWRVGKKRASRILDARTWDEFPEGGMNGEDVIHSRT